MAYTRVEVVLYRSVGDNHLRNSPGLDGLVGLDRRDNGLLGDFLLGGLLGEPLVGGPDLGDCPDDFPDVLGPDRVGNGLQGGPGLDKTMGSDLLGDLDLDKMSNGLQSGLLDDLQMGDLLENDLLNDDLPLGDLLGDFPDVLDLDKVLSWRVAASVEQIPCYHHLIQDLYWNQHKGLVRLHEGLANGMALA